jgi:D-glycero-D-manno-heptose 1,7-bisphosphate phosphatase
LVTHRPKLIILDRDGVINQDSPHFIKSAEEWHPIPGSLDAIAALKKAGFLVAVCTNQSGIGRGYYTEATLSDIHAKMTRLLAEKGCAVDAIIHCPHLPEINCACRKPKPGMIHTLLGQFQVQPKDAWVIGDSFRDLQAGMAAGCPVILVKTGNGEQTLVKHGAELAGVPVFEDLKEVVLKSKL